MWLTHRLLKRQTVAAEASVYVQISESWSSLDELMLKYAHEFTNRSADPVGPFVMANGLPNPDPRLYVAYRFFGTVEQTVLLCEDYQLGRPDYLQSLSATMTAIMSMAVVVDIWNAVGGEYPENVQQYVNSFVSNRNVGTHRPVSP